MLFDKLIIQIDHAVNTLLIKQNANRISPAHNISENFLSKKDKKHINGLLRVNHCGEICAQALYYAQSMLVQTQEFKTALKDAGTEELDHLIWLQDRLTELGGKTSILDPIFYLYSFTLGITMSMFGNNLNFAFINETEQQVLKHLNQHIALLPKQDLKSLAILQQMIIDEEKHSDMALKLGNKTMSTTGAFLMKQVAKIMTKTTYYL
jgi:ubiquinone biosynthesis monooxygenase Coq7